MTFPVLRDYSLDACLRKTVKVEFLTPDGVERHEGILFIFNKPWTLHLLIEFLPDDYLPGAECSASAMCLPFAGNGGGIVRIRCEGQVVFINKQLPRPYPRLDLQNDDDREALNNFRRNIWGDLYLYGPGDYRPPE